MDQEQIKKLRGVFSSLGKNQSLWWTFSMQRITSISWHKEDDELVGWCEEGGYIALENTEPNHFAVLTNLDLT